LLGCLPFPLLRVLFVTSLNAFPRPFACLQGYPSFSSLPFLSPLIYE
jgi:hypothetical protein